MLISALVALALAVIPLPSVLDQLRPDFLVLVVFYWSIESPRAGGLALAFFSGLALDVINGVVLGQHALALTSWRPGPRICGCACGCSRCCRNPDHFRVAHAVSVHLVLDRRRHRQSRGELRPLARAR